MSAVRHALLLADVHVTGADDAFGRAQSDKLCSSKGACTWHKSFDAGCS